MHHVHLEETPSTQSYLKENWKSLYSENPNVLVSTSKQTQGQGRQGNNWHDFPNSLAFSFLLQPNEEFTLSSLELGVLLCRFFKDELKLKWPNDLINLKNEKCGGILCQVIEKNLLVVGMGINLESDQSVKGKLPAGIIQIQETYHNIQEELPEKIYQYILNNRLNQDTIQKEWNQFCFHLNQKVRIEDSNTKEVGTFVGIGPIGEALIQNEEGKIKKVLSGSLFLG